MTVAKRSVRRNRPVRRPVARPARTPTVNAAIRYVESSALLAALLEHDAEARQSLETGERLVTSALTIAEASRAILRARVGGRLTMAEEQAALRGLRAIENRCFMVDVDRTVLARVGRPFPVEPIRTLDAVHLATAEMLGEPPPLVTIVTRDARVRDNARALGYAVE